MITIESENFYKLSEVVEMHPILRSRGIRFLYDYRQRQIPGLFINTSQPGKRPRYFIKGDRLIELLDMLDSKLA